MRERTTWNRTAVQASLSKKADPFSMNQDHKQPATDAYTNGDPSSWAEDVHSPNDWEQDYANGEMKRDEVGLPVKHKEASDLLLKKADLCVSVARLMLSKKASDTVVEDQALALMSLSDQQVIETFNRLANDDEQAQEQAPAQEEAKQAQGEQQQQAPAAEQMPTASEQAMTALAQGDMEGMKAALEQMVQQAVQGQQQAPAQQAPAQAPMQAQASSKKKADEQQSQEQAPPAQESKEASPAPVAAQDLQAMINAAVQAALAAQQGQQQMPAEEPAPTANEEEMLLDDMLAQDDQSGDMMASGEIELEANSMDFGDAALGPEDEALKQLFATEETAVAAPVAKTAATRTVGTKPSAGVAKVGGAPGQTKTAATAETDNLSALWASAPDVREHFGMK